MIMQTLRQWGQQRFNYWLKRRMPGAKQQQLSSRNIFILPTRFGFAYLLFMVIVFVLGTNYQNNIIILLSYVLGSFFLTVMLHSFFNLSGIRFSSNGEGAGYAEQTIKIPLTVINDKPRYDVNVAFEHQMPLHISDMELGNVQLQIPFYAKNRGVINPGRVKISSEYSFGLFVCWTKLDFDCQLVVYPQPKAIKNASLNVHSENNSDEQSGKTVKGNEDFGELRQHREGEPLSQIAWKQLARGQGWLSKSYIQQEGSTPWLRLKDMPTKDLESKLQILCFLIIEFHKK